MTRTFPVYPPPMQIVSPTDDTPNAAGVISGSVYRRDPVTLNWSAGEACWIAPAETGQNIEADTYHLARLNGSKDGGSGVWRPLYQLGQTEGRKVIAVIPPVNPADELVLQQVAGEDGWYDARVVDPVTLGQTAEAIWVRFLNERPPYVPAYWRGIARLFGTASLSGTRPAYLIEALPVCRNRVRAVASGNVLGQAGNIPIPLVNELVGFSQNINGEFVCEQTGFYWLHVECRVAHVLPSTGAQDNPDALVQWYINGAMYAQAGCIIWESYPYGRPADGLSRSTILGQSTHHQCQSRQGLNRASCWLVRPYLTGGMCCSN